MAKSTIAPATSPEQELYAPAVHRSLLESSLHGARAAAWALADLDHGDLASNIPEQHEHWLRETLLDALRNALDQAEREFTKLETLRIVAESKAVAP